MPSESETYEPLDPPDNESDTSDVESGPSNLDEEQEEELMRSEPRRSTRETNPVMRLEPSMMGKSYLQEKSTQATGSDGSDICEIEYYHYLIAQVHPNPNKDVEYKITHAMLITRCMDDINNRVMTRAISFAQQFLLHKGLKVFENMAMRPQPRKWTNYTDKTVSRQYQSRIYCRLKGERQWEH